MISMSEWKPLIGRITLFPTISAPSRSFSVVDLYRRLWDSDPDGFQNQTNVMLPTVAHGKRNGITAQLLFLPARIDINLLPASNPDEMSSTSLVLIEDTNQFHRELRHLIEVINKDHISDSASRVAISVQFVNLKSSSAETNKALLSVLPKQYRVNLVDETDFVLQVNRPRPSHNLQSVRMNFLRRWSTERLQVMRMAISSAGLSISSSKGAQPEVQAVEFPAASVSFDNNNAPDPSNPLGKEQQAALLTEGPVAIEATQKEIGLKVEGF